MIFILTGTVQSGKTSLLGKIVGELKKKNLCVEGFLSEAVWENQVKIGYDFLDLKSGKSAPFVRRRGQKDWERVGPYFFIPEVLRNARELILSSGEADLVVVDEVGPLELSGKGVWPALSGSFLRREQSFLLVARRSILENLIPLLGKREIKIFEVEDKETFSRIIREIGRLARNS